MRHDCVAVYPETLGQYADLFTLQSTSHQLINLIVTQPPNPLTRCPNFRLKHPNRFGCVTRRS